MWEQTKKKILNRADRVKKCDMHSEPGEGASQRPWGTHSLGVAKGRAVQPLLGYVKESKRIKNKMDRMEVMSR